MDAELLRAHVREHTGLTDPSALDGAIRATLSALGILVAPSHRHAVARALPDALAGDFATVAHDPAAGRDRFVAEVAASEHVPKGRALEHATALLDALATHLPEDVRGVLSRELPSDVQAWLEPRRERGPQPREEPAHHGGRHHLSDGRPGSDRPISDSEPPRAHSHSVAASPTPHADTKLSTAPGTTQVREHESLAEGHPKTDRTLAEGGD